MPDVLLYISPQASAVSTETRRDIQVEVNQLDPLLAAVIDECLRSPGHVTDRSCHAVSKRHKRTATATPGRVKRETPQQLNVDSLA